MSGIVVMVNMPLANVIHLWSLVLLRRLAKVLAVAGDINIVFVGASISILPQIAHLRVLFRGIPAAENIRDALVRPVLVPALLVVLNIILLLVLMFVKKLMMITVGIVRL